MEVEGHPGLQALSAGRLLVKILYPCLALAVLLVVARIIHAVYLSPLRQIPGPLICRLTDLCLTYHDSRLSRNQKIFEWHEKYGDVVLIAPGQVSFASAAAARELYSAAVRHPKSSYFDNLSAYGFRSIFMIRDHTEHQQMKKRTFRCYQPASIYRPSILGDVRDLAKRSRDRMRADLKQNGATINIFARCNSYSFDNITRFALGPFLSTNAISEAPEERAMFIGWEECEVWGPFGSNFPTTQKLIKTMVRRAANDAFLTGDDRLGDWTNAQVATAMEEPRKSGEDSLLHQLLQVKTENGDKLPAGAITEEIFDNFLAAQSVVTNALVFLLWDLATHPDWQSQIRKEIQALPTDGDGLPIFIEINSAPILDACLRESSRVHPLSSGRAERVIHETKAYEGIVLPAGTIVSASTKALHYKPDVFPDPHVFSPERWMRAAPGHLASMNKSFMPYGQGARVCLGVPFAMTQMKLLIAFLLLEFEFREDTTSATNAETMSQLGTQSALPRGLRCDLHVRRLDSDRKAEE